MNTNRLRLRIVMALVLAPASAQAQITWTEQGVSLPGGYSYFPKLATDINTTYLKGPEGFVRVGQYLASGSELESQRGWYTGGPAFGWTPASGYTVGFNPSVAVWGPAGEKCVGQVNTDSTDLVVEVHQGEQDNGFALISK